MFKKEHKNYVTKYAIGRDSIYSSELYKPDIYSQPFLEAQFENRAFTRIEYCYCGNVKTLSGIECKRCEVWTRFHR